jgi:hypothetical protein
MISKGNVVVTGSLTTSGSLTTTGTITATTLVVQTITSSISSITGSTNFGSLSSNTHTFTGSINASGSATFTSGLINGTTDAFFDINRSASGNAGRVRFQTTGSDEFEIGLKGGVAGFHITKGDATELLTITSGGEVGIGTTTPQRQLTINSSFPVLQLTNPTTGTTSNDGLLIFQSGLNGTISNQESGSLSFETNNIFRAIITSGGISVFGHTSGVGTNFSPPIQVKGGAGVGNGFGIISANNEIVGGIQLVSSGTNSLQITADPDNLRASSEIGFSIDGSQRMVITNSGNVGIQTGIPDSFVASSGFGNLVVGSGSGEKGMTIYSGTTGRGGLMFADATTGSGAYIGYIIYNHSTDTMELATSSVPRFFIKSDGRTWVGNPMSGYDGSSAIFQVNGFSRMQQIIFHNGANVAQQVSVACNGNASLNVDGAFSASSKSFLIPHPLVNLESTHNLRYVSVESPQADLIYRGKLTLVNGKAQANIDEAATMTEGTFEALCREVQCFTTNESGWDLVKGKVIGNIIYIESQNANSTDEISWMVIGERKDKYMMDTSWTDENGKVIVEPLITSNPENTTQEII